MTADRRRLLEHVRGICTALPEVTERLSHGTPSFFVRERRAFVNAWIDGHHDDTFPHLWCAAPMGAQEALVRAASGTFFRPPYVGHRGWVGMRLDGDVDWDVVRDVCDAAFRSVAPRTLVARLDEAP